MKDSQAARKYAQALFAAALAKNEILACQQGLQEIMRIAQLRKSLSRVLEHPFISPDEKKTIIHSALGEYSTPLLETFFQLLVQKHRFNLLSQIADQFQDAVDRHQNIQPLRIRSAYPMTEAQRRDLQKRLESWLKSQVRMDVQVDPQLIGGLVIQTRDRVMDQSLKGQLKRLQQQLSA